MNSDQFVFWLQGFFELTESNNLSANQVKMIREHLKLVFNKVTPPFQKSQEKPIENKDPKYCKDSHFDKAFREMEKFFDNDSDFDWRHPNHPRNGKIC